jgi:anti-anti-sigma regulatory factor
MFETSIKKSGEEGILTIKGDLTINYVKEMKNELLNVFSRFKHVKIIFNNIDRVDFSCIQLLCSAHKSAHQNNKTIVLAADLPNILCKIISNMGFQHKIDCFSEVPQKCLWLITNQ